MAKKTVPYLPSQMQKPQYDPYAMPSVQPIGHGHNGRPAAVGKMAPHPTEKGEPLYEIMRQPLGDMFEGLDEHTLQAIAQASAIKAREAQESVKLKYYREPFWYAVNIGEFGETGVPIVAGATSPAGANRVIVESTSNFEGYFGMRYSRDETTGAINNARSFRAKHIYAGSTGVSSQDNATENFLRNQNIFGSAQRPARYVWPRVYPADSAFEIALINDEANDANFQIVFFGNKVFCGVNPRLIVARPPFIREPFSYGINFTNAPFGQASKRSVQFLQHADFELLYITQDSPDGSNGDFDAILEEAAGGNKGLSNIPLRREAAYGTIERPTILTYPRYYTRGSRLFSDLTNRAFNGAAQSYQMSFHGNLIV